MWAALNGLAEFAGGALLVLGLITPLGSATVAGVMLVAIATVHWRNGFFNSNGGYEFNLLIVAVAIARTHGPGTISSTTCRLTLADPNGPSRCPRRRHDPLAMRAGRVVQDETQRRPPPASTSRWAVSSPSAIDADSASRRGR
jgi:hypothetical protein